MSRPVILLEILDDKSHVLSYLNYKVSLKIYKCQGGSTSLDGEIRRLDISPDKPIAVIPEDMIESAYQVLQGALYYMIADKLWRRTRNKGLLLAILITGRRQIKDYVDEAIEEYSRSKSYYTVVIAEDKWRKVWKHCVPITIDVLGRDLTPAVKNLRRMIQLL